MWMRKFDDQKGFTLVEIMIVIVIVALLAGIGMPKLNRYLKASDTTDAVNMSAQITAGIASYVSKHHNTSMANIKSAINNTYSTLSTSCGSACIGKMIPTLQLPSSHAWTYKIAVDVDGTESNRRIETCVKAYKASTESAYVLYSSIVSAVDGWEANIFRAPYVYGGSFVAGGACSTATPSASATSNG